MEFLHAPALINTYIWNMSTLGFTAFGEYLVTANNYYGISILDLESIASNNENVTVLQNHELNNYPNPFNPTTTISFSVKNECKIEISIYNIKGQKVKQLVSDQLLAGQHSIIWNGEDNAGKKVGSGVYLYKLNVNGKTETIKKCLLMK